MKGRNNTRKTRKTKEVLTRMTGKITMKKNTKLFADRGITIIGIRDILSGYNPNEMFRK